MPSKTSKKKPSALPTIPMELIDHIVDGPMTAEAVNAASMAFKKALIERALGAELSHHLGYAPGTDKPEGADNHRNGVSGKTVLTEEGPLRIDVPRDRQGRFEPLLIPKHERRFTGFDDKIVAMYARGMTVREIQGFPPPIRRVIYTTNARLRKIIKTRGHFPSDDAATKLIWLALRNITADWGRAAKDWKEAMNQFAILYDDRFVRTVR